ncbi:MAG: DNA-binding protein [Marinilabiliales bacterium]|nr:MAG: DNA-binding protein [Marinilabiliales bacterium]
MSKKLTISNEQIENRIFTIRGIQVMIDFHLAYLYQVETKRLNEQVKRNKQRFPERYMFQLTKEEWLSLQSQFATTDSSEDLQSQFATTKRRTLPYAFTEQGVAMLSAVLKSDTAINASIMIIDAFISLRKLVLNNASIFQRLDKIELKQLENDKYFEQVFKALESNKEIPPQGVFFEGQVFDAYELSSKIIRSAKQSITLIDNYIDENTITQLAKKAKGIKVLLLTKKTSNQLALDVKKANEQYGDFDIKQSPGSHDRFLIIDEKEIYHLGASLKDLGKKLFAFSQMDTSWVERIINEIQGLE